MNETVNATPIFAPLWRYKWLILLVGLLAAAGTYKYYKRQPSVYSVSTQLYLGAGAEEAGLLSGANTKALLISSGNQTILINSALVEEVHRRLRREHQLAAAHGTVRAKAAEKSQFITITTEARTPKAAALLANLTARSYIERERMSYLREVEKALAIARRQLRKVQETQAISTAASSSSSKSKGATRAGGGSSTSLLLQTASLSSKVNQLETELSIKGVQQLAPAKPTGAVLLSPKPRQNALFGLMIGLLLGAVAAYGLSRINPRLRTLEDVERIFKTQILAALPAVRRAVIRRDGRPGPSGPLLEPLRRLHTTLQLGSSIADDERLQPRSIVFVSADPYDGKSTLLANLAGVQCEAGEHVVIVDADLRRPAQARLHDMARQQGLVEVLEGRLSVHEALQLVDPLASQAHVGAARVSAAQGDITRETTVQDPSARGTAGAATATRVRSRGVNELSMLANAGGVANPPALLGSPAMGELLHTLVEDFDHVLIDAPSPLEVSDVMPLLNLVEGIVIVARIGHTREASARRLQELLARTASAPVLGTVAGSVRRADIERYGFSSPTSRSGGLKRLLR